MYRFRSMREMIDPLFSHNAYRQPYLRRLVSSGAANDGPPHGKLLLSVRRKPVVHSSQLHGMYVHARYLTR